MANSDNRLRSFLCPKLWQCCKRNDDDENEDTNLLLQAVCSTTAAALLLTPGIFQQADSDSDLILYHRQRVDR